MHMLFYFNDQLNYAFMKSQSMHLGFGGGRGSECIQEEPLPVPEKRGRESGEKESALVCACLFHTLVYASFFIQGLMPFSPFPPFFFRHR